jgi:predicted methyltransferase MtxX (methanogen marker protein 4)
VPLALYEASEIVSGREEIIGALLWHFVDMWINSNDILFGLLERTGFSVEHVNILVSDSPASENCNYVS